MPVLATMVVEYVADTTGLGVAVTALAALGAAAVGVTVAAVKMAGDFQSQMELVSTGAGAAQGDIASLSNSVLNMAVTTATSTTQLTAGLFQIYSAGQSGAQALNTLEMSAEGAKTENADLGVVANAVTTIMTDYAGSNVTASQAVNTLIAVVQNGKTNLQDLSSAMSSVMTIASTAGVPLNDIAAAFATMTHEGVPAADAATYLRQTILALDNPTTKASDEMKAMGLNSATVAAEMKISLPDALQMITDAAGKKFPVGSAQYVAAVATMVGGTKSLQGIFDLTGQYLSTFKNDVNLVANAVDKGGNSIIGWSNVQNTFNFQLAAFNEAIQVLMIRLGTMLLPVLGQVLGWITPLILAFTNWANSGHALSDVMSALHPIIAFFQPIIAGISTVIGPLVVAFGQWVTSGHALSDVMNVLKPIITAVQTVVTTLAQAIGPLIAFLAQWIASGSALHAIMSIVNPVVAFLTPLVSNLWAAIVHLVTVVSSVIAEFISWLVYSGTLKVIIQVVATVIGLLIIVITTLINWLANIINWVQHNAVAMQVLQAVLIAIGIVITTILVVALAMMISSLIAAGIAFVVASWPIIALIAVIALIVFAIMHFGEIMTWIGDLVGIVCHAIGAFFEWLWNWLVGGSIVPDMINAIIMWFTKLPAECGAVVQAMVTAVVAFFTNLWNSAVTLATNLLNGVRNVWNGLSGMASGAFNAMSSAIMGVVNGIITWCFNAGSMIVQNIANGIRSAIQFVTSAVQSVASAIANFLPHSPAKMGPLVGLSESGTEISNQIAKGMINGVPLINSAISNLTKPIQIGLGTASVGTSSSPLQGGSQDNSVHIYLDGKEMTNQVMKRAVRSMRGNGLKK